MGIKKQKYAKKLYPTFNKTKEIIMSDKKILVIGGAGYIGSHVVKSLLEENFNVTVYDNLSTGQRCNLFQEAKFIEGDILDVEKLEKTMSEGFDAVVHLAAKKAVGESMEKPQMYDGIGTSSFRSFVSCICMEKVPYDSFYKKGCRYKGNKHLQSVSYGDSYGITIFHYGHRNYDCTGIFKYFGSNLYCSLFSNHENTKYHDSDISRPGNSDCNLYRTKLWCRRNETY